MTRLLQGAAAAAAGSMTSGAFAQSSFTPSQPVRIIVPWGTGVPYNTARLVADKLKGYTSVPVLVEPKTGAGGAIGFRLGADAPGDGHTLVVGSQALATTWALRGKDAVDPENDLVPVSPVLTTPYVIVAKPGRFESLQGFFATAKASPGKYNYASPGVGTGPHFTTEFLKGQAGVDIVHVPYRGGAEQLTGVLAGEVDIAVLSLVAALTLIKTDKVQALALTSGERADVVPAVPTIAQSALPGFPAISTWFSIFGPRTLNPEARQYWSKAVGEIVKTTDFQSTVASWGAKADIGTPQDLARLVLDEKARWLNTARQHNIHLN